MGNKSSKYSSRMIYKPYLGEVEKRTYLERDELDGIAIPAGTVIDIRVSTGSRSITYPVGSAEYRNFPDLEGTINELKALVDALGGTTYEGFHIRNKQAMVIKDYQA